MATASSTGASRGAITGINITPLVDITLVLLIVFMVTARLIVRREGLPLDLPKASSGQAVQEVFAVVIGPDGSIRIDGEAVPGDDAFLSLAGAAVRADRELRAVIQADGSVPHRRVMHALDLLRRANVAKIAFGVVPPAASANTTPEAP
jgi:biopolymer transport protein ExbD